MSAATSDYEEIRKAAWSAARKKLTTIEGSAPSMVAVMDAIALEVADAIIDLFEQVGWAADTEHVRSFRWNEPDEPTSVAVKREDFRPVFWLAPASPVGVEEQQ